MLTLHAPPADTAEEMTRAIHELLEAGADAVTEADLHRRGFTTREIAEHREAALAEARRRFAALRCE